MGGRYLFWTLWLGRIHTRVVGHLQSAEARQGVADDVLFDRRYAAGRDAWLAGLSLLVLLTHSAKVEEDSYWLKSDCLLIFWGKFGGGTSAGLHFCFCFPQCIIQGSRRALICRRTSWLWLPVTGNCSTETKLMELSSSIGSKHCQDLPLV